MSDLPKERRSVKLSEVGTWLSGGTPFTDEPLYWGGDIPWISAASLKDFHIGRSDRCITGLGARAGTRLVPAGTVLFVVRGMSLKKEFRIGITERQVAFGQDCKAIIPASGIDGEFLALTIKAHSQEILSMVDEAGHGTGRLPVDLVSKVRINIPELQEQQRVVEVLGALDGRITNSQRIIEKLRLLRDGLVHKMIVDAEGKVVPLSEVADHSRGSMAIGPFGSDLTINDYKTAGAPVIFVRDIKENDFRWISGVYINESKFQDLRGHVAHAGDILLTKMGLPPCIAAVYPYDMLDGIITADIIRIRPNVEIVDSSWLAFYINSYGFRRQVAAITGGITRPKVTLADVRHLMIKLPELERQLLAVEQVSAVSCALHLVIAERSGLLKLKRGLMQDLLTERVQGTDRGMERVGTE